MDQNNQPKKDSKVMDQVALASFADSLIKERFQENLPENLDQTKAFLLREINEAINSHLITLLDEGDQVSLDELLDKNISDDELNKFFLEKIPNLEVEIASALLNFRAAYILPLPEPVDLPAEVAKAKLENNTEDSTDLAPPPPAPVQGS